MAYRALLLRVLNTLQRPPFLPNDRFPEPVGLG